MTQTTTRNRRSNKQQLLRTLLQQIEEIRVEANSGIDPVTRAGFGQFMTPTGISTLMASMFTTKKSHIAFLDPGGAVGSLTAAFVAALCSRKAPPKKIDATVYEIDGAMIPYLERTISLIQTTCDEMGIEFHATVINEDFIVASTEGQQLFGSGIGQFDCVIMNPPYRKINSDSTTRAQLRSVGIETSNLYTAFMGLGARALVEGGEFVSITPRSFCNGPYFHPFRQEFLKQMRLERIHVFESRNTAFKDDEVLQENVIVHAVRDEQYPKTVTISTTQDDSESTRKVPYSEVIRPNDADLFIHITTDDEGDDVRQQMAKFTHRLTELGISVSTGRVVDFRARKYLRKESGPRTMPLIYPGHFKNGFITWPVENHRKANALVDSAETASLFVDEGIYVLAKRFSAKEERRRVVAAVYDPTRVCAPRVGFENHLNYFHQNGKGLDMELALGLCVFLNSTLLDEYFRQFNGHTQVNATDLRNLHYPSLQQLRSMASEAETALRDQDLIDSLVLRQTQ